MNLLLVWTNLLILFESIFCNEVSSGTNSSKLNLDLVYVEPVHFRISLSWKWYLPDLCSCRTHFHLESNRIRKSGSCGIQSHPRICYVASGNLLMLYPESAGIVSYGNHLFWNSITSGSYPNPKSILIREPATCIRKSNLIQNPVQFGTSIIRNLSCGTVTFGSKPVLYGILESVT